MEISPVLLAKLLFYSFCFGIAVGVFYDAIRIIRVFLGAMDVKWSSEKQLCLKLPFSQRYISSVSAKKSKGFLKNTVLFITDLATVLTATLGVLVLNYAYNSGRFRFFTVAGLLVGFLLYYFTFGKLTVLILAPLAFFIKYAFFAFFAVLCMPFKIFLKFLIKNVRKIYFLYQNTLEKRRKREYNIYERVLLLEMSKNGFLNQSLISREEYSEKKQEV